MPATTKVTTAPAQMTNLSGSQLIDFGKKFAISRCLVVRNGSGDRVHPAAGSPGHTNQWVGVFLIALRRIHVLKGGMCANSRNPVNRFDRFSSLLKAVFFALPILLAAPGINAQTAPQPPLPTIDLQIGSKMVRAEIADEEHERAAGLMFRGSLAPDSGMLFVMGRVGPVGFWMKNTAIPLTIAYIDPRGTILELHDLKPLNETPVQSRFRNIAYALEMPQGWFSKNNVWPGERVSGLQNRADR